ncbi:solute carrier family 35 member F5 isoform X2 [Daktulosphaira vitifoliae]|uniref:solute carrier family 35 member F5 isoform X2 n=1 Tax=Daktulosphaira vitifoliae TaxID=58002 RepID=UPI0021AA54E5|nr:solute carrier family 35 member F5 isoform X2 [Daktulosphaira vitifoliae]
MHNLIQRLIFGLLLLLLSVIIWVISSQFLNSVPNQKEDFKKPFFFAYAKASIFTIYLLIYVIFKEFRKPCKNQSNYMFINFDAVGEDDEDADNVFSDENNHLSSASYVPVKNSSMTSGTESDDSGSIKSESKIVRFNKVAEVRHLSETEAKEALMSRLSYAATLRAREVCQLSRQLLNLHQTTKLAFTVAPLIILIIPDMNFSFHKIDFGFLLSLSSALFYALNIVTIRSWIDHEDKLDITLYFGLVGLFNVLMFWPIFIFLHYFEIETFEWPSKQQVLSLIVNGIMKTTLPEVIWLWGCLLTSSIIATMSIGFIVPINLILRGLNSHKKSDGERLLLPSLYFGLVPIVLSFFTLIWLTYRKNYNKNDGCFYRFQKRNSLRFRDFDSEQAESLIQIHETDKEM